MIGAIFRYRLLRLLPRVSLPGADALIGIHARPMTAVARTIP